MLEQVRRGKDMGVSPWPADGFSDCGAVPGPPLVRLGDVPTIPARGVAAVQCGGSPSEQDTEEWFSPRSSCSGVAGPDAGDSEVSLDAHASSSAGSAVDDLEAGTRASPLRPAADWWAHADPAAVKGLEALPPITRLLDAQVVQHGTLAGGPFPWDAGESPELYAALGAHDPRKSYVAFWMTVDRLSMLAVSEVVDANQLESCIGGDPENCLQNHLKMLICPVRVRLPFPSKGPRAADTMGSFFGRSSSCQRIRTPGGVDVVVLQVDLFSKWLLRIALMRAGFQRGNVVDVIVVDWPGQAVFAAQRVHVTDEFVRQLS